MYRTHLFNELCAELRAPPKRILEIGPKDGLDSQRLASLNPGELVMIDLPEKREAVDQWLHNLNCNYQYIEGNFMYMEIEGPFDVIWCTGVLYHNAEQLRMLRRLFKLLNSSGYLVLESATTRNRHLRNGAYVEIHYPQTYRDTGTITHLPSKAAIRAWLEMVGFAYIQESHCYDTHNPELRNQRYAVIAQKGSPNKGGVYYGKSGLNPDYYFGDSM